MKRSLLFVSIISVIVVGSQLVASAQENTQIEGMQKQMMEAMQKQMMKNMGGGLGGGGGGGMQAAPAAKASISPDRARGGEAVFGDTSLGTNGKSCKTCHAKKGAKPLDGRRLNAHLIAFIQYCYNNALKGPGIMAENKLNSIVDYFTSLQH